VEILSFNSNQIIPSKGCWDLTSQNQYRKGEARKPYTLLSTS